MTDEPTFATMSEVASPSPQIIARIVHAKRPPRPKPPKPQPIARIVYSPSPKTRRAILRWERLTGRTDG